MSWKIPSFDRVASVLKRCQLMHHLHSVCFWGLHCGLNQSRGITEGQKWSWIQRSWFFLLETAAKTNIHTKNVGDRCLLLGHNTAVCRSLKRIEMNGDHFALNYVSETQQKHSVNQQENTVSKNIIYKRKTEDKMVVAVNTLLSINCAQRS